MAGALIPADGYAVKDASLAAELRAAACRRSLSADERLPVMTVPARRCHSATCLPWSGWTRRRFVDRRARTCPNGSALLAIPLTTCEEASDARLLLPDSATFTEVERQTAAAFASMASAALTIARLHDQSRRHEQLSPLTRVSAVSHAITRRRCGASSVGGAFRRLVRNRPDERPRLD